MIAMLGWNVNEMNILFGKENKGFGISRVSSTIFLSVGFCRCRDVDRIVDILLIGSNGVSRQRCLEM